MSLGFLTESSILPKKAKSINVGDDTALFNLQSSISSLKGSNTGAGGEKETTKRKDHTIQPSGAKKKDAQAKTHNKDKAKKLSVVKETLHSDHERQQKLKEKAALYDRLKRGEIDSRESELLVDFDRKRDEDNVEVSRVYKDGGDDVEINYDGMVDIIDDMGRNRKVKVGSKEHMENIGRARKLAADKRKVSNAFT